MKNILKAFWVCSLFILVPFPLYASSHPIQGESNEPVIIGVPVPLSGRLQAFGQMMKNSFEMAAESVNGKGGIHGRPLKLVFMDDQGEVAAAEKGVRELIHDQKPVMLVGGYASDPTFQMARTAEKMDVPFLICTASADRITQMGWKNTYRLNPPVSEYSKGLEDFWIKVYRPKSMAIMYENTMFGTDGAKEMMAFSEENGIAVQAMVDYDKTMADSTYFRSIIAPLTLETPDVVYMISYLEDAVLLVKTLQEINVRSLLCGGAGGFTMESFIREAGSAGEGLVTATLWSEKLPYPGAKAYFDAYLKRYSSPPDYHGAEAFSSILVAADALRRSKSFKPQDIRQALDKTYMMTPFGPVKFYSYYDFERQNSTRTLVLQIIDQNFEIIWPPELSTSRFVAPKR